MIDSAAVDPRVRVGLLAALVVGALASTPALGAMAEPNCLPQPSRCGFPDATNTGVPPGAKLQPTGSFSVRTPGAVVKNRDVTGSITVAADNVTIEDSRITTTDGGPGSVGVVINQGATGTTIQDTTIRGPGTGEDTAESAVWNQHDEPRTLSRRNYFYNCADCWEGSGTFRDNYMVVDSIYSDAHAENIYICSATVDVDHSTLINKQPQTATVFGDTICGGGNQFTVTNSLLAGGGYLVYPAANSSSVGNNRMNVSNNRFARCRTGMAFDPDSGGTKCSGGSDASGYFPNGGYFGIAAYDYSGEGQTWNNNVWDDNLQAVCPDETRPGFIEPLNRRQRKRQRRWERRKAHGLSVAPLSPRRASRPSRLRCWSTATTHPLG